MQNPYLVYQKEELLRVLFSRIPFVHSFIHFEWVSRRKTFSRPLFLKNGEILKAVYFFGFLFRGRGNSWLHASTAGETTVERLPWAILEADYDGIAKQLCFKLYVLTVLSFDYDDFFVSNRFRN